MEEKFPFDIIVVLGPTASGKTSFAVRLAQLLHSEIISADSRQVYKGMTIGTGKDLAEYNVGGENIPYHLIDICEAGEKYNLFRYQKDFFKVYQEVKQRTSFPILCGGTGLYIESLLKGYNLPPVPEDKALREELKDKSLEELTYILKQYKTLHNITDIDTSKRAIRAIEIAKHISENPSPAVEYKPLKSFIIGLAPSREVRRERITKRLYDRLNEGMIEEVQGLLQKGIPAESLLYYGLEYKYITLYLLGKLSKEECIDQLEIAIHQFAKRQMTWFRGMERRGSHIHWITNETPQEIIFSMKIEYDLF